jgi:hypothetical protein
LLYRWRLLRWLHRLLWRLHRLLWHHLLRRLHHLLGDLHSSPVTTGGGLLMLLLP